MPDNGVYRFGVFELDSRARELKKHGVRIKLQDQPLRILLLLVQHPGEVVTREQIQSELWPAGTYVDYENAINSSVRKVREALADDPANPRFVETLSRRGYRLLVPVSDEGRTAAPPEQPRPIARRFRWPMVAAAGVLVLVAIAAVLLSRRRSSAEIVLPPAVPLTSYAGQVCCPSISPDGTRVAFAAEGPSGDNLDIYVTLIGQGEPLRLTRDAAADTWPAWSPDGRWIAFERSVSGGFLIMLIPAMGGTEREITRILFGRDRDTRDRDTNVFSLSWSADGKYLFAADGGPDEKATWITRVSVEAGEKERITFPPATAFGDSAPAVSPKGDRLAFAREVAFALDEVYVLSLDTRPRGRSLRRITAEPRRIGGLAWTPDGSDVVFSAPRGGGFALWQVPGDGHSTAALLTGGGDNSHEVATSAQGRLIYSTRIDAEHLWRVPISGDSKGPGAPFLPSTRHEMFPQYSPDGARVAFESNRSGHDEIWVCNADGTAPVQLTSFAAWSGTPRWSPEGDRIVFDSNSTGNWDIFVVRSHGGKPVQLTVSRDDESAPSWSRDGKWIYFCSRRTGRYEIWKIPSAGGPESRVTKTGGFGALEAPSGKELYFTKDGSLWRITLPDGSEQRVAGPAFDRSFEPAARGVYFAQRSPNGATLKFLQYGSSEKETVASLGAFVSGMTISPDERFALYSHLDVTNSELMLVDGFGRKHGP